jgi:hypothetical protein
MRLPNASEIPIDVVRQNDRTKALCETFTLRAAKVAVLYGTTRHQISTKIIFCLC